VSLQEKKSTEDGECVTMKVEAKKVLEEMKAERDLLRERNSSRNRFVIVLNHLISSVVFVHL
jgi:hypothetical protein